MQNEGQSNKNILQIGICAIFIGFGQKIIANSSWKQTRSSFYANLPLERVLIGEERGGVVWKAWHNANAALWRKCASPDQAEVRLVLWHQRTFSLWLQKPNRLRGAESPLRCSEFDHLGAFYARMFFSSSELKSKFGITVSAISLTAWNSCEHLIWPLRRIHIWDCRKTPWISSATLTWWSSA